MLVETDGFEEAEVLGAGFDHGVVKEDVGIEDVVEDLMSVIDSAIVVADVDDLGGKEAALGEEGDEDLSVDLAQFFDAAAFS